MTLKEWILSNNYTVKKFAREIDVSCATLYRWIRGATNKIPVDVFERIKVATDQQISTLEQIRDN